MWSFSKHKLHFRQGSPPRMLKKIKLCMPKRYICMIHLISTLIVIYRNTSRFIKIHWKTILIFICCLSFCYDLATRIWYHISLISTPLTTRKLPVNSNGRMERLMCNFHYLGYYCSPNLSIHQNSTQEPTWNFLVTLDFSGSIADLL